MRAVILQADGKIIASYDVDTDRSLVRLLSTGDPDTTFRPTFSPDFRFVGSTTDGDLIILDGTDIVQLGPYGDFKTTFSLPFEFAGRSPILQRDGKLLVTIGGGQPEASIIRLNPNGSVDPTFHFAPTGTSDARVLLVQADQKVVVQWDHSSGNAGAFQRTLIRLQTDGSADPSFKLETPIVAPAQENIWSSALEVGGQLYVARGGYPGTLERFRNDGTLDTNFPAVSYSTSGLAGSHTAISPHRGGLLFYGNFHCINGSTVYQLVRLDPEKRGAAFSQDRLSTPRRLSDGKLRISLQTSQCRYTIVESSSDFHKWLPAEFEDSEIIDGNTTFTVRPTANAQRFYRISTVQ